MSHDATLTPPTGARARLDGLREHGADRLDPVRFHMLEAMDRRAAAYDGGARQRLDERLAALLDAYAVDWAQAAEMAQSDAHSAPETPAELLPELPDRPAAFDAQPPATLAELIDYITQPVTGDDGAVVARAARPDMEALLEYFRSLWSSISADRQVQQSQEQVHKNAGPLNSNHLVHRALSLMRTLSPGYLQQFLSYTDNLIWMEQMTAAVAAPAKDAPRTGAAKAGAAKKSTRAKSR